MKLAHHGRVYCVEVDPDTVKYIKKNPRIPAAPMT